ncbi:sigma 54-interacting transcriptional regulator [Desulfobacterota bacterium AH_259_B03_O07]|nr:sigma 54-interacting transcriptional regulator [Desulfobacterota bacterium AH_259_B03_O07]
MSKSKKNPSRGFDEDAALRSIVEGTSTETGERFFEALVENLATVMNTRGAWVTEYLEDLYRLRSIAFWFGGKWIKDYEYDISGTPCGKVIENTRLIHIPDKVMELYPDDPDLEPLGAISYIGVPLLDTDGGILGHLAVLDNRPMPENRRAQALIRIFANRAATEMQRLRVESELREREEKLSLLVDSAMDAIIELDHDLKIVLMNSAAEKVFNCPNEYIIGKEFKLLLSQSSHEKLINLIKQLDTKPEGQSHLWIPGGLESKTFDDEGFKAEATLSCFEIRGKTHYTIILRNVNARIEAEKKISSLTKETKYLKEEIKELHNFDEIIGKSKSLLNVFRELEQVADTDTTVLILGETGTGKELIARAIHASSPRRDKPLIKVNCAAIPASLIESEFFGHEQGAFTGATKKREGRFSLADGGAIFLDEIGELPLDLQVKLLRILQEGEFEPVGSSKTVKVDVRIIAATNRDLHQEVQKGRFREDLFYRLNVFPIIVPSLRERKDDIALLANSFVKHFSQRIGRDVELASEESIRRLISYDWPGNIRELQNVIERAVITSSAGKLNLESVLPDTARPSSIHLTGSDENKNNSVKTMKELQNIERNNIILALEKTDWRVSGENGAAQLLGIPPSTLSSRIKALGIKKPRKD